MPAADSHDSGAPNACGHLDLDQLAPGRAAIDPEITAITMAELHQGVAMAKNAAVRATRAEKLGIAIVDFDPLPFDSEAATRYGSLVALTLEAN